MRVLGIAAFHHFYMVITEKSAETQLYYIYGSEACFFKALVILLGIPQCQRRGSPKLVLFDSLKTSQMLIADPFDTCMWLVFPS